MRQQAAGKPNQMQQLNSSAEYLSDDKENSSEDANQLNSGENEMKRKLFENLKRAGVLDGMKSTLRGRLYEQLRIKSDRPKDPKENQLSFKLATSLVADLM